MAQREVATNVHFIPLPMLSAYKSLGYKIEDYPNTYAQYYKEISLPVYFTLEDEQVEFVIDTLRNCM